MDPFQGICFLQGDSEGELQHSLKHQHHCDHHKQQRKPDLSDPLEKRTHFKSLLLYDDRLGFC